MNTVYIVMEFTVEQDQDEEWPVAVYPDKETAEQHCKLAKEAINEAINKHGISNEHIKTSYDERVFYWHQTRVSYSVKECIFARHVDEFLDLIQE